MSSDLILTLPQLLARHRRQVTATAGCTKRRSTAGGCWSTKNATACASSAATDATTRAASPIWPLPSRSSPARTLVLDGEIAIYDRQLRSRFDWLREPDPDAVASPPLFMVFDLLYHDRRELTGRPLRDRRARLEDVVACSELVFPVRRLAADGLEAWQQVAERDFEGYVAKDEASLYEAGPTRRWLKVKQKGWTDQEDRWQRRISSRA